MLANPATLFTALFNFMLFPDIAKGTLIIMVMMDIETIVPIPNRIRYSSPAMKDSIVGNNTSMTAALPASPCMIPITKDFILKKGFPMKNFP